MEQSIDAKMEIRVSKIKQIVFRRFIITSRPAVCVLSLKNFFGVCGVGSSVVCFVFVCVCLCAFFTHAVETKTNEESIGPRFNIAFNNIF